MKTSPTCADRRDIEVDYPYCHIWQQVAGDLDRSNAGALQSSRSEVLHVAVAAPDHEYAPNSHTECFAPLPFPARTGACRKVRRRAVLANPLKPFKLQRSGVKLHGTNTALRIIDP